MIRSINLQDPKVLQHIAIHGSAAMSKEMELEAQKRWWLSELEPEGDEVPKYKVKFDYNKWRKKK